VTTYSLAKCSFFVWHPDGSEGRIEGKWDAAVSADEAYYMHYQIPDDVVFIQFGEQYSIFLKLDETNSWVVEVGGIRRN
jgi:hypothetical protein